LGSAANSLRREVARELEMIQVNIAALTHLTKLFLPAMIKRRSGRILNLASTAAFQPGPGMAVYYATKAYVLSFSEALAEELRNSGVSVTPCVRGRREATSPRPLKSETRGCLRSSEWLTPRMSRSTV